MSGIQKEVPCHFEPKELHTLEKEIGITVFNPDQTFTQLKTANGKEGISI